MGKGYGVNKMHKLITSSCRKAFDEKVKNHLSDGWNVLQGTMYAAVVNTTKEENTVLTKTSDVWEDNVFAVFLQGHNHQVLVTAQSGSNFEKFVNSYLDKNDYKIIPGTIYATALQNAEGRVVTPYISVTLQKHE